MRIRISDLTPQGLEINEELPVEPLNTRLNEGGTEESQFIFTKNPTCALVVTPIGTTAANVQGTLTAMYTQDCALCLDQKERSVSVNLLFQVRQKADEKKANFKKTDDDELLEEPIDENDIGILYFQGDTVELDEWLQEELILKLDLFWHPEFKKEKCTLCKKSHSDLGILEKPETKTTLGDLLNQSLKGKK